MDESSRCPVPHRMGICDRLMVVAPIFRCSACCAGMRFTNTHGGDAHTTHKPARLIKSKDHPQIATLALRRAALLLEINELPFVHPSGYLILIIIIIKNGKDATFLSRLIDDSLSDRRSASSPPSSCTARRVQSVARLLTLSKYEMRFLHPTSETQSRCRFPRRRGSIDESCVCVRVQSDNCGDLIRDP